MACPVCNSFENTSFAGISTAQYLCDFLLWEQILNTNPHLKGIVELGSWNGGFSRYLYAQAEARGLKFLTFDIVEPESPPPNFERLDIYRRSGELSLRLKEMGPIALFCDGGNKPRELRTFPPHLAKGSVIVVHDWMTETLPTDVPDFLEELYGEHCDAMGSASRVFTMKESDAENSGHL